MQIKQNIAQYINSLKNGQTVYLSSIFGYIYKANGVVNVSNLKLSTDGSTYSTNDITTNNNEVARINVANIEMVVVSQ